MTLAHVDYDLGCPTKTCAGSGKEFSPGEVIFSVLIASGSQLRRLDYSAESWHGPPEGAIGWWRSRVPLPEEKGPKLAPAEILLEMFRELESDPTRQALRYVLGLLLVRRRLLRLEGSASAQEGREVLQLASPDGQQRYTVLVQPPGDDARAIEEQLTRILFPEEAAGKQGGAALALLLAIFLGCCGCQNLHWPWVERRQPVFATAPTLAAIMEHVNKNSAKVQSLRTTRASLFSSLSSMSASADVYLERPRNFRLLAGTTLTGPQVDLGSNDQELWFWLGGLATGGEPAMYFSRHEQFQQAAARRMMPIDPAWMVDAFGLPTFRPEDEHEGPRPVGKGRQEVRTIQHSPLGSVGKVTIVDEQFGDVLEQHLYDPQGKLMASSLTSNHAVDPASGAWLPRRIEIRFPAMQSSVTLDVGTWEVNKLEPAGSQLFARPHYPHTRTFDLGSMPSPALQGQPQSPPAGRFDEAPRAGQRPRRLLGGASPPGRAALSGGQGWRRAE